MAWPKNECDRFWNLSKNKFYFKPARRAKLDRLRYFFMCTHILNQCRSWKPRMPRIGARSSESNGGSRICRLPVPYHPMLQQGLQHRLEKVRSLWASALAGSPFGDVRVQVVYSNGGVLLHVVGRRRRI